MNGYSCPFCPIQIVASAAVWALLREAFESHLDGHMARGDQLLVPPSLDEAS